MSTIDADGNRWPDLFVVGAGRAGTTSLWHYLSQHPDVFMSELKETNFFTEHPPTFQPVVRTQTEYLRLFEKAGDARVVGEASPSYLRDPASAGRIRAASPEARIVIVVRHPVERAWSSYWHARRYGLEQRSFEEALDDEGARASGLRAPRFVAGSLYSENVGRYLDLFGDRVLVLVFEELFADVRRGMRRIFEFAEVDPGPAETFRPEVLNQYSRPRNPVAARIYSGQAVRFLAKRAVPARFHHRVERVALARGAKPLLEPRLRRLVAEMCAEDVKRLEEILGRSLPWDLELDRAP